MPTYDYVCDACNHKFELFQSITESVKKKCPECKTVGRILAGPDYDRWKLTCCHCGHRFRLKQPPEGFTQ